MATVDLLTSAAIEARNAVNTADLLDYQQHVRNAATNDNAVACWVAGYKFGSMDATEAMHAIVASVESYAGFVAHESKFKDCYQGAQPIITADYELKERIL